MTSWNGCETSPSSTRGLDNVDTAVAFAEAADEIERLRNELLERDLQIRKTLPKVPYRFVPLGERDV